MVKEPRKARCRQHCHQGSPPSPLGDHPCLLTGPLSVFSPSLISSVLPSLQVPSLWLVSTHLPFLSYRNLWPSSCLTTEFLSFLSLPDSSAKSSTPTGSLAPFNFPQSGSHLFPVPLLNSCLLQGHQLQEAHLHQHNNGSVY